MRTDSGTGYWHPALVMVGLVLALPFIAAVPLASPVARIAVTASPLYLYTVGLLVLFSAWIGQRDPWLGGLGAWVSLSLLWTPTVAAFETVETLVMSVLAILLVRTMPEFYRSLAVRVLVGMGLFQVLDGLQQWAGYDVLWHGLRQIHPIPAIFGTTGNSNYYGVYLASIAPLAPWWAVPIFLVGIVFSHSILAMVAVAAGLLWRVRDNRRALLGGAALALAGVGLVMALKGATPLSGASHRVAVWLLALESLSWGQWIVGAGPGSWGMTVPLLQIQHGVYASEVFLQGHNEWIQLLYENGLVAVGCLCGWLWAHRPAWTGPYGPALLAILVCSFGMFGFRLAMTACVGVMILALATAEEGVAH